MASRGRLPALLVSFFAIAAVAVAQRSRPSVSDSGPPLLNWRAPTTYTPLRTAGVRPLSIQGGELTGGPLPFFPVTPCRQYDSRPSHGGPGALANNTPTIVNLSGGACLIPFTAAAISVNITAFDILGAGGNGVFKVGIANPPTTAWINYPATETQRANAGVVSTDGSGNIWVEVNQGAGSIDLTIDVNGYYYNGNVPGNVMPAGDFFQVQGDVSSVGVLAAFNYEPSATDAYGLDAITESTGAGSAGAFGAAVGATGLTYGVFGTSFSTTFNAAGIHGEGNGNGQTIGIEGICTSGPPGSLCTGAAGRGIGGGGYFTASDTAGYGVQGIALGTTGRERGVIGREGSLGADSTGVLGLDATGPPAGSTGLLTAGVRGESASGVAVLGLSQHIAVVGDLFNSSGTVIAFGDLGSSLGPYGVYSGGDFAATGAKLFVEPHPTDASRVIRYVSLEGPESGTYFRGSAQVVGGSAVIDVPESFRMVTDAEGLTVQVTPIGDLAMMAVMSKDLEHIVVRSSKDIAFDYLVHGVRRAFKDFQSIRQSQEFMPRSGDEKMPGYLTEEAKQRLIANGTYNADGTVNMATAERLGWTKIWADREAQARAAGAVEVQKTADGNQR